MIDPEFKKKDFSFYIHKIKKIAPLSFQILGEEFFAKNLPFYFQEVVINDENLLENILYFPLYVKKYQTKLDVKDHILELMDYEFAKYQIETDPTTVKLSLYNDTTPDVYLNPLAQAIRHEYDIHEYVLALQKNSKKATPKQTKTLLLVSKNPAEQKAIFKKGNIHHAAIIDELHDGKMAKKDLLATLQTKYPEVAQSEWVIALKDLKSIFFTLES